MQLLRGSQSCHLSPKEKGRPGEGRPFERSASLNPLLSPARGDGHHGQGEHLTVTVPSLRFIALLLLRFAVIDLIPSLDYSLLLTISSAQRAARSSSPSFSGPSVPLTKKPSGDAMRVPPFFSRVLPILPAA